ncbi:carbohydrate ABC transporter permease [Ectobacillus polymachus]|uniref:carbohydrate ABC transporter permease n=1 Tax=Ectobacillus polymachus TaxID=1508806 RepID=UPI003A885F47
MLVNFKKIQWKTILLLTPAIVILSLFVLWPTLYTLYLSFFDWNMIAPTKSFVGLANYTSVLTDPITYKILVNTFWYIVILLILNFVVPYIFAFVLHLLIRNFKNFFKSAFFLPSFISLVVGSILATWILNPISGPVARIAQSIGLSIPNWSQTQGLVIVVISFVVTWKVFGYNFITLYAAISGISNEVIEAAKIDNIPSWRILKDIVMPMSGSTGVYILIMTIVTGLQYVYSPVKVMTQGGPDSGSSNLIYQSYHQAFEIYSTGTSAAFSMLTLCLFVLLLFLEFWFVERGVHYEN